MAHNTLRLKVVPHVVAILLVASACGSSSTAAKTSPPASAPASPSASTSASAPTSPPASPSASPSSSPTPPVVGGYGVLYTQGNGDTYTVSLVGVDGRVVASATPTNAGPMTCANAAAAVVGPPVSASDTRVYFQDAQGDVNFLSPNGETGLATHVPIGATVRSMFAVSPDDRRIAVVEDTFVAGGATTILYVEDLNGGTNHVKIFTETGAYTLWPIGWHDGLLVVAKVASCTQGGGPFCCGPLELHVVDPATGFRRYTVGGTGCVIAGTASPAGVTCENTSTYSQATVLNWTGGGDRTYPIQGPEFAYLSPDGNSVALVDNANNDTTFAGAKQTLSMVACGWIDSTHVIAGGDTQQQALVGDVTSGALTPVAAQGTCGGRIPGGL